MISFTDWVSTVEEQAPVAPAPKVHRIAVTVSEPDHPMVSKRKETQQKFVRVTHHNNSKEEAQKRGEAHFRKKGYKVHGSEHAGMMHEEVELDEATYQGKTVPLNKPMKGDVKKSKVYVDPDGDGKAQKVNFGDKNLSIKKNIPARKRSYCARSSGQGNLNDKTSANYWSRRAWDC